MRRKDAIAIEKRSEDAVRREAKHKRLGRSHAGHHELILRLDDESPGSAAGAMHRVFLRNAVRSEFRRLTDPQLSIFLNGLTCDPGG